MFVHFLQPVERLKRDSYDSVLCVLSLSVHSPRDILCPDRILEVFKGLCAAFPRATGLAIEVVTCMGSRVKSSCSVQWLERTDL